MTAIEAKAAIAKYGSQAKAAKALGVCDKTIRKALLNISASSATSRSLSEFRATYDKATIIPAKIRAGLAELGAGWEYEVAFAKMAGLSLSDLGSYREQFIEHVVVLGRDGRRAWAGTKKTAQAMRSML